MIHLIYRFCINNKIALIKNINSDIIKKIHLFIDDNDDLEKLNEINSHKIVIISVKKNPDYNDFFNYVLDKIPNEI